MNKHLTLATVSACVILLVFASASPAAAPGELMWAQPYGTRVLDKAVDIGIDASGNAYVVGFMPDGDNKDYGTIKYDTAGNILWAQSVQRFGKPFEWDPVIAVSPAGDALIAGSRIISHGFSTNSDILVVKYDSDGTQRWTRTYGDDDEDDEAHAVAVDSGGNAYVAGYSKGKIMTRKFGPNGGRKWARRYYGPVNSWSSPDDIAIDKYGNVYVTGSLADYLGGDRGFDSSDIVTIKYGPDGRFKWARRLDGPAMDEVWGDRPSALAIDPAGNILVTGVSEGLSGIDKYSKEDLITIKYGPRGKQKWVRQFNGPANRSDEAKAIAVDMAGNAYITGTSEGRSTGDNYLTIKYNKYGQKKWARRYNGPASKQDYAEALALDSKGNLVVTGMSYRTSVDSDYATLKYSPRGVLLWLKLGDAGADDWAKALAVDGTDNIYVTGQPATVKYAP